MSSKAKSKKAVTPTAASTKPKRSKSKKVEEEKDQEEEEEETHMETEKVKTKNAKRKRGKANKEEEDKVEDEASDAMEEEPPKPQGKSKVKKGKAAAKAKPKAKGKAKGKKKVAEDEDADKDDEEEEVNAPAKKKKKGQDGEAELAEDSSSSSSASSSSSSSSSSSGGSGGRKPDRELPGRTSYSVYEDYATLLNQTNITGGANNNKFYVIQILTNPFGDFFCWTRWGRVGEAGQNNLESCDSLDAAKKSFEKKFKDKTKNSWSSRGNFTKFEGKYALVDMDEDSGEGDSNAPLGKLSKGQIEKGQQVLATLRKVIEGKSNGNIGELSASYYTLIPTVVGRQAAPAIKDLDALTQKEELLKFMLRMGFDEIDKNDSNLSPIDGVMQLTLPKSLEDAAGEVTDDGEIEDANERGEELAEEQAGKPAKQMAASLYAAIMLYTSNAIYADLNKALREEKRHLVRKYFKYLRLFFEALGTLPAQKTTLWRGISVDLDSQYTIGETITWWGVSSCTSDESVARAFMSSCGGKTTLLTVHCQNACEISCMSFFPHEAESLLAPGTKLKVLNKKINGTVTEIELQEVGCVFRE